MTLTKENVSAHIEDILNDPDKKQILVDKLIESGLFDIVQENKKENLVYEAEYFLESDLSVSKGRVVNELEDGWFSFSFKDKDVAEKWSRKLTAFNKLRMIKEMIDDPKPARTDYVSFINIVHNCYISKSSWIQNFKKTSAIDLCFISQSACERAIELMGKQSLDDLFLGVN